MGKTEKARKVTSRRKLNKKRKMARRIAILGATGATGAHLVKQALDDNHHVVALVRTPEKVAIQHANLTVHKCDIFSIEDLKSKCADVDVIVSCLGAFGKNGKSHVEGYSESIKCIAEATRQNKIEQLIVMGSWYNEDLGQTSGSGISGYVLRFFLRNIIGNTLQDMKRMREYLDANCADPNWLMVNPPGLINEVVTTKKFTYEEGDRIKSKCDSVQRVSRADVARFMLATAVMGIHNNEAKLNKKQIALGVE